MVVINKMTFAGREDLMTVFLFYHKNKSSETELQEMKREGLISCDAKTQISRQNSLEFIIESVHFVKADIQVDFYMLFILCIGSARLNWP